MRENPIPDLCAVVLAGGSSRRMGRDKALLQIDGRPLIERVTTEALRLTDELYISANDDAYDFLSLPVITDLYPGQGPLAGLHSAMIRSKRPLFLLLACDLPSVRAPLLRRMVRLADGHDVVIPRTAEGRLHPLCGVYRRTCFDALEHNLQNGINKVADLFRCASLRLKYVDGREGEFHDEELRNLNTPEDLATFLQLRDGPHNI